MPFLVKKNISGLLAAAVQKLVKNNIFSPQVSDKTVPVEYPLPEFGDYASPLPMQLASVLRQAPLKIAETINNNLDKNGIICQAECVKPGYINMRLNPDAFTTAIIDLASEDFFRGPYTNKPESILLEFVSANPTGPLHIGHGRWAAIGDILGNILSFAGHKVQKEFYINDAGVQIKKLRESAAAVKNGQPVPEDGYHGDYIKRIVQNPLPPEQVILEEQKNTLQRFRTVFDNFFPETKLHTEKKIEEMITFLEQKGYSYKKEGALWFCSMQYGDDKDRVLIKENGEYTYFAVDIAYHYNKISRGFSHLINVFGADHHGYVKRIQTACRLLSEEKTRLTVLVGQLVNLFRNGEPVRMSKRTGDMITLEEVIDEIGVDAARYFLSCMACETPLDFDLAAAIKQSADNPVYYIQYAHARICSVYNKAAEKNCYPASQGSFNYRLIRTPESDALVKYLMRFPDEISEISVSFEIHRLHKYLYSLAGMFHRFYFNHKIINPEEPEKSAALLFLSKAVEQVLKTGLRLLNISAPEKM
ncbi:MAG: arginine--tRNA ligase [Spirochaetes bacterium GWF1_41_5]|nr:MAG: arginine--tRNA ligase [Spirochaetes bacterium GWF1_41_5]HBE01667.1 arginine--tRNA ligase [Spirochaetia bacterium]